MAAHRLRGPWPHVSVSYEIRLINSMVIPEAAKRLSGCDGQTRRAMIRNDPLGRVDQPSTIDVLRGPMMGLASHDRYKNSIGSRPRSGKPGCHASSPEHHAGRSDHEMMVDRGKVCDCCAEPFGMLLFSLSPDAEISDRRWWRTGCAALSRASRSHTRSG